MKQLKKKKGIEKSVLSSDAWLLLKIQSGLIENSKVKKANLSNTLNSLHEIEKLSFINYIFDDCLLLDHLNELHKEVLLDNFMQYCSEKYDSEMLDKFTHKLVSLKNSKEIVKICTYLFSICDRSFAPSTKRDSGVAALCCLTDLVLNPTIDADFKKNLMYQTISRSNINSNAIRITILDIIREVGQTEDVKAYQVRMIHRFGQSLLEDLIGMSEDKKLSFYCEKVFEKNFSTYYATSEETSKITFDLLKNHMLRYPEIVPSLLMRYIQQIENKESYAYSFLWLINQLLFASIDLGQKNLSESLFRLHLKLYSKFPQFTKEMSQKTLNQLNTRFEKKQSFIKDEMKKKFELIESGGLNPKKYSFLKEESKPAKPLALNAIECLMLVDGFNK